MDFGYIPLIVQDMLNMMVVIINYRDENKGREPMCVGELYGILDQIKEATEKTEKDTQLIEPAKGKYKKTMQADEKRFIPKGIIQLLEAIVDKENRSIISGSDLVLCNKMRKIAYDRIQIIVSGGTVFKEKYRNPNQSLGTNLYKALLELNDLSENSREAFKINVGIDVPPTPETAKKIFEVIFTKQPLFKNNEVYILINQFRQDIDKILFAHQAKPAAFEDLNNIYCLFKESLFKLNLKSGDKNKITNLIEDMNRSIHAFLNYDNKNLLLGTEYKVPDYEEHEKIKIEEKKANVDANDEKLNTILLIIMQYIAQHKKDANPLFKDFSSYFSGIAYERDGATPEGSMGVILDLKNRINTRRGENRENDKKMLQFNLIKTPNQKLFDAIIELAKKIEPNATGYDSTNSNKKIYNVSENDIKKFERITGIQAGDDNELINKKLIREKLTKEPEPTPSAAHHSFAKP